MLPRPPNSSKVRRKRHAPTSFTSASPHHLHYNLTPATIQQCRTGYTRLVSIKQFRESYNELQKTLEAEIAMTNDGPDLSVDDIFVETPFQAIDKAINNEVIRITAEREEKKQQPQIPPPAMPPGMFFPPLQSIITDPSQSSIQRINVNRPPHPFDQVTGQQQQQQPNPLAGAEMGVQHLTINQQSDSSMQPTMQSTLQPTIQQNGHHTTTTEETTHTTEETDQHMNTNTDHEEEKKMQDMMEQMQAPPTIDHDPNFGATIPDVSTLLNPLIPLKKQRKKNLGKRLKREMNCMTSKTFEYDIKQRTEGFQEIPIQQDEVLLRVAIFHPITHNKTQEFICLGSQPLTALRDRISCISDTVLDGPQTPSSFFFIENKFYNDTRQRMAIKYSDTIIEWVKSENRFTNPGLSHFESASMENTCFNDLSIRLGSHYLYGHQGETMQTSKNYPQGDCHHVIIFTELRIRHNFDISNSVAYPLRPFTAKTRRKKCRVCDLYPAAYVCYGDKLASENPMFYCEECYRPLHYSYQGNLLYDDFQVYSYDHE